MAKLVDVSDDLAELMQNSELFDKSTQQMLALKKQYEENHRQLLADQNQNEQKLQRLEANVVGVETERKTYLRKHAQDLIELKQVYEAEKARLEAKSQQKAELFEEMQARNYEDIRGLQTEMQRNKEARMLQVQKLEELQLKMEESKAEFDRYTQQVHQLNRQYKSQVNKFEQLAEEEVAAAVLSSPYRTRPSPAGRDIYASATKRSPARSSASPQRD